MNAKTKATESTDELIYLDNAATTYPKPPVVYEAADAFYRQYGGNAGRGNNPLARACSRLVDETRHKLAVWLDAPSVEQVIFTSSATHALNLVVLGADFRPNDTIYVTPFEHNSILRPIEHLRQTQGVQVQQIPFNRRTYKCQIDKLQTAFQINPPTMVCVTQASNVTGMMPPVVEIAKLAKQSNPQTIIVVDAAQTAGLYPLPLNTGLIDALIFSGHKSLYSVYGIAGIVLGSAWRPKPLFYGGTGTISESVQMPTQLPSAYEAGSHNIWAIAGLNAALNWLQETGRETIIRHQLHLASELLEQLSQLPTIDIYAPKYKANWCGILSVGILEVAPQVVENSLGAKNVAVRAGLHCAPNSHQWLKTVSQGGTARLSTGFFNKAIDIDTTIALFASIA